MIDIRHDVEQLDDNAPFVMLPLRLETLFVDTAGQPELWVRVFPDDCWITAFDPALTLTERLNGWAYWAQRWAAADVVGEVRAAWAALVQAHGAGRAAWIVRSYSPTHLADMPTTRAADAVVLVAATDQPVSGVTSAAAATFWVEVWRAGGTPAAEAASVHLLAALSEAEATTVRTAFRPLNLAAEPPAGFDRASSIVTFQILTFPVGAQRDRSFSQAPSAPVFPDQLRLVGMTHGKIVLDEAGERIELPLYAGPDPTAGDPELTITSDDRGELVVGEKLAWMFDFDRAVKRGLGFRVKLEPGQAAVGFDRLFVIGVHLSDAETAAKELEDLLLRHRFSAEDFEYVPVGSPTNNTDGHPTSYQRTDDPAASFATVHRAHQLTVDATRRAHKADGQRFAEVVGFSRTLVESTVGGDSFDIAQAEAINTTLWPATLGYFIEAMLATKGPIDDAIVSNEAADNLRVFFNRHVTGRGPAPAVRIGRQPYGIVATTAFSRVTWPVQPPTGHTIPVVELLAPVLAALRSEWLGLSSEAVHLPAPDDTTAADLAAVLGLQASSASIYQRYGEPAQARYHLFGFSGDGTLMGNLRGVIDTASRDMLEVLRDLGYRGTMPPELASKLFRRRAYRLQGPMVSDLPLSESAELEPTREFGINYLQLLAELAMSGLDDLRLEAKSEHPPTALLYLLGKFALERGYQHRANELLATVGVSRQDVARRKFEPPYVHVGEKVSASRWRDLYSPLPALTGSDRLLHEFITEELRNGEPIELSEQVEALRRLAGVPTAKLDRLVAEHIDVCGYRLDAWLSGLVSYQLELMRFGGDPHASEHKPGMYLGAYGWLEEVRPRPLETRPVEIADEAVKKTFERSLDNLVSDPANGGFIAAPSLDHATTAAVLRAGYVANAYRDEPEMMAVNLSSERLRHAQVLLEGIRNGQGLGELLGYRLERELHDRSDLVQIHTVIYALREAFPLRAGQLAATSPPAGTPIEAIEARNVVDGQKLLEQARRVGTTWPFGAALPSFAAPVQTAVEEVVHRLEDLYDAVADLALAEGVHQLLAGNHERAAATLDAFSQGGLPPEPDVIASPRRHLGITHQVVLHLDPAARPGTTPRSVVEPSLNAWLAAVLPDPTLVGCVVRVTNAANGSVAEHVITQAELGFEPIDVLMVVDPAADGLMSALDYLLVEAALSRQPLRADSAVVVLHAEPIPSMVSFFQLAAVINDLRPLLLGARPLRSDDIDRAVAPPADAVTGPRPEQRPSIALSRITGPLAELRDRRDAIEAIRARLSADRVAAAAAIDSELANVLAACRGLDGFAMSAAGRGSPLAARREAVTAAVASGRQLAQTMDDRLARCNAGIAAIRSLPAGTPNDELVARWIDVERTISTVATQDRTDAAVLEVAVLARQATFVARRADLAGVLATESADVADLIAAIDNARVAPPSFPELLGIDLDPAPLRAAIDTLVDDLIRQCAAVVAEADRRIATVEGLIAVPGGEVDAAQALFSDGTPVIGQFDITAFAGAQLSAARADEPTLLDHARSQLGLDDPVRDWRFGVARVRPPVWRWESVETVLDALHHRLGTGLTAASDVAALQLPRRADESWYALQYPPSATVDHDVVCYTVINPAALPTSSPCCGLVLDEWPEQIPLPERTVGLAVHHDRPASEPPQAWLVVTPPRWDGRWHWADLVMALSDTLDLARIRAVEPDLVDRSRFGALLPATVFPVYPVQISMTLNLALNNAAFRTFREG